MAKVTGLKNCANKNARPNKGLRELTVLSIVRQIKCLHVEQTILMKRFEDTDALYLYTNTHVCVYQQPAPEIKEKMNAHRQNEWQYLRDISDSVVETCSKFILYPTNERILMLANEADNNNTFKVIEKALNKTVFMFRFIDMSSFIELPTGISAAPKSEIQRYDYVLSLTEASKKRERAAKKVDPNLPFVTVDELPLSSKKSYLILPYDGEHDQVKYLVQVSDDQVDSSRSERVCSTTGSKKWVFPNSKTARFYLEPQIAKGSLFPIATHRSHQPAKYPEYIADADRLDTFNTWTFRDPSAMRLCQAGFFYTMQGDLVRCYQCGIGLKDFDAGDDPLLEHVRYAGKCPYLQELLGEQRLKQMTENLRASDPEYSRRAQLSADKNTTIVNTGVKYPRYQTLEARISSFFSKWPSHRPQTPHKMAGAGLFYSGPDDCVTCYTCGGSLKNWEPEDDPFKEHSHWFPSCSYVRLTNGNNSVESTNISSNQRTELSENVDENQASFSRPLSPASETTANRRMHSDNIHDKNKDECLEMGYTIEEYVGAIKELRCRGAQEPNISDIIDVIENTRENQSENDLLAQNRRLRSMVYCMHCKTDEANMLFLPCTHHIYCASCSDTVIRCPLCQTYITEKIRTYMS